MKSTETGVWKEKKVILQLILYKVWCYNVIFFLNVWQIIVGKRDVETLGVVWSNYQVWASFASVSVNIIKITPCVTLAAVFSDENSVGSGLSYIYNQYSKESLEMIIGEQ